MPAVHPGKPGGKRTMQKRLAPSGWERGVGADAPDARAGLLDLDAVRLADDAQIYLCGNNGFVQAVREQLVRRGVAASRVHCELFSPNDWLLG